MEPHTAINIEINGRPTGILAPVRETLADTLRHRCRIRSVHLGCEHGVCGACTVWLDGATARSCLTLAATVDGHSVETVESDRPNPLLRSLRDAFSRHHALQCGFCTPGFLLTAAEVLSEHPDAATLTADEVREVLSGNICRCTGYQNIVAAVLDVARSTERPEDGPGEAP